MTKLTQTAFLTDWVAAHQTHPSQTPDAYEKANQAWADAGGSVTLNEAKFLRAYRTWHVDPSGDMRVGPAKRDANGQIIESVPAKPRAKPTRNIGRVSTSRKG